jgi:hypothetical protein
MRVFLIRIALPVIYLAAVPCTARALDAFPPALRSYPSSQIAAGELDVPARADDFTPHFTLDAEDGAEAGQQSWWPLLYSGLVPGLGELTMGYEKRGIALMAVEVLAWSGYFVNHTDGLDERDAYEAFADQHWDYNKWLYDHPCTPSDSTLESVEECGRSSSGSGDWPGYIPYVSKEEDKQHYYENLGKYDWYISGWTDWDETQFPYKQDTALRTQYREMRQKSNDSLDTANSFIWISVAARAFSLVETAIIIHNRRDEGPGGGGGGAPISLRARPRGYSGGEVALEVRFR